MARRILVVEDEKPLQRILRFNLEREGYEVESASDGPAGLSAFRRAKPDLIVLDAMLPGLDGFDLCKAVRRDSATPILFLTARKEETDRVLGLELGADDYMTKPFSVRELLARIKAILRRGAGAAKSEVLRSGAIELDEARHEARIGGAPVGLRAKEFALLKVLLDAGGRVLSREDVLERVWGHDRALELDTRTVDQHVARLREKLGRESGRLVTIKNVGYRLKAAA